MNAEAATVKVTKAENFIKIGIWVGVVAASILVVLGFITWGYGHRLFFGTPQAAGNPSSNDWGNYGSYLQGTTVSLWSLAGFFIIFVAFLAQKQQLLRQDVELHEQRRQFQLQRDSIKHQDFENNFFQLLNLHHKLVEDMLDEHQTGRNCFRKWYDKLKECYQYKQTTIPYITAKQIGGLTEREFAVQCYDEVYRALQGDLGHYFRNLYHLIKFVHRNTEMEYQIRRGYTTLVRAQLSSYEQALLFYDGLHPVSEDFRLLIQQYGLFHNLDERLLLNPRHKDYYDRPAYEGSGASSVLSPPLAKSPLPATSLNVLADP